MDGFTTESHKRIAKLLKKPLPGQSAQYKMAPGSRHEKTSNRDAREAGVLILLYPRNDELYTVLIQRPVYQGVHSGQISFPGGKKEPGDHDLIYTALRETHEEVGIPVQQIHVLGKLTPLYIPVSNHRVQPVIGSLSDPPRLVPDKKEVERIYQIRIRELMEPDCLIQNESILENNRQIRAPFFKYDRLRIWGATAMILSEFLEICRASDF
ncbi:MAG: CoA pyrophosphatase [Bacteroidales bacterium]|nr:CoA pyrophosphatase [Bacteroidales bacterium]